MPTSTDTTSRRAARAARTRAHIADTALALFAERGFAATSTKRIAEAAGVSEGLVFRYFPTKRALLEGAMASRPSFAKALTALLEEAADEPVGVVLPRLTDAFVRLVDEEGPALSMLVAESRTDPELHALFVETFDTSLDRLGGYLAGRVEAGELRGDLEPRVAAAGLLGPLLLFFLTHDRLPTDGWADAASEHATAVLDGWLRGAGARRHGEASS